MNRTDSELMAEYGITCIEKTIYSYKKHNYERLKDVLRYAEMDRNHHLKNTPCPSGETDKALGDLSLKE